MGASEPFSTSVKFLVELDIQLLFFSLYLLSAITTGKYFISEAINLLLGNWFRLYT